MNAATYNHQRVALIGFLEACDARDGTIQRLAIVAPSMQAEERGVDLQLVAATTKRTDV
jgi:hypothetical protein